MPRFALTLSPAVSGALLTFVEALFIFFVVGSFVCVAVYSARKIAARKLLASGNAPLPLTMEPRITGWLFAVCVMGFIFLQSPFFPFFVIVGAVVVVLQNQRTTDVQFGFNRLPIPRAVAWSLLIFGAIMLVETPLTEASDMLLEFLRVPHPEQETVESFRKFDDPALIFLFMFQAVLFNPIIEELFFRGFLLTFLKNYTTPLFAIILSGGVFAFAHLNIGAAIPLWFLGIALGLAYEHTGSLIVPITVHGCFNLATGLSLLLERGTSS
jgi:membrane protease YdiL (CAAX protease family)